MRQKELDQKLYEMRAQVCRALSHPTRLKILDLLAEGECSVEEITKALDISKSSVSQHLGHLKMTNIVESRQEGKNVFYRITNPKAIEACHLMKQAIFDQLVEGSLLVKKMAS